MPDYETRLLFFVDILGFRKMIESQPCDKVHGVLTDIRRFYDDELSVIPESKQITLFSDSIIISIRIENELDLGEMFLTFCDFQNLIANLIMRGVFVRGAISYGAVHHDEKFLFGPAFVEAYLAEKNACFPRVVCSDSVIDLDDGARNFIAENPDYEGVLAIDADGLAYIDYFAGAAATMDSASQEAKYIHTLKTEAQRGMDEAKAEGDKKIEEKYNWVLKKIAAAF